MCVGVNVDEYVRMNVTMNKDSSNDDNDSNNNDYYEYAINACVNDAPVLASPVDSELKYMGMLDSGANVNIATLQLAIALGLPITDRDARRQINTADKGIALQIQGWINVGGYIGEMAVVGQA